VNLQNTALNGLACSKAKNIDVLGVMLSVGRGRVGDFTRAQKNAAKANNAAENNGQVQCHDCGRPVYNRASVKGQGTPPDQAQVHHQPAIEDGGGRDSEAIVLCPSCHINRHK
jgi:hypothetical protein